MRKIAAVCRVQPVFGDQNVIERRFGDMGFKDYKQITILPSGILVEFYDAAVAAEFRQTFDGTKIRGSTLQVDMEKQTSAPAPPSPKRAKPGATKTVVVRNYPSGKLTERRMYELFWECGYLKQIEVNGDEGEAVLQFDQEGDAANAVERYDGKEVDGAILGVSFIKDRVLNMPQIVVPIRRVLPDEGEELSVEFQSEIREFCRDT